MYGMHLMIWLDSREFPAIMLACLQDMPTARVVQLNDWLFASRVKLLSIFSWPPCMIAHTFLLFGALYYVLLLLDIHSASNPSPHTHLSNQIKSNQNSILLRSFSPSVLVHIFLARKDILSLSLSEISCRFLLSCLTTTPSSLPWPGMDRWMTQVLLRRPVSQYTTACMVPWKIHGPHCT